MPYDGLKYKLSIGPTHKLLTATLGVGHHTQYVAPPVNYTGDIVCRAVGVGIRGNVPIRGGIAEHDLPALLQSLEGGFIGEVVTLSVGYGNPQDLTRCTRGCKGRGGMLNTQTRPLTTVLDVVVSHEHTGE